MILIEREAHINRVIWEIRLFTFISRIYRSMMKRYLQHFFTRVPRPQFSQAKYYRRGNTLVNISFIYRAIRRNARKPEISGYLYRNFRRLSNNRSIVSHCKRQ